MGLTSLASVETKYHNTNYQIPSHVAPTRKKRYLLTLQALDRKRNKIERLKMKNS
jgi:hypothetical protein